MAAVKSLGVHKPTALPYLIDEGFLPPEPGDDLYQRDTYVTGHGRDQIQEEVVATTNAIVWSQGSFIRNVYRFDNEGENVLQAILTNFSRPALRINTNEASPTPRHARERPIAGHAGLGASRQSQDGSQHAKPALARALVVLLRSKAHIYFLDGGSHIVELPFEVDRAFAVPRGLLLQRKRPIQARGSPTPQIPAAPPNSFFSFPGVPTSSFRHSLSPTLVKSFAKTSFRSTKPLYPSPLGGDTKLDALFQDVIAAPRNRTDEDITNLYSLTDPLSDIGVVTYSLQHHKPRMSSRNGSQLSVEYEGLDPAEKIIYASPENELGERGNGSAGDLTLLVTLNMDLHIITLWHAWYIDQKSLKSLLQLRADHKAAKARRRSSFVSANAATGAATPAVRRRDGTRESFAAGGLAGSQNTALSRKPTREEEEEAMASQMDPDYLPAATQQPARENRRISSMNADVRASQTTVTASFGGTGGRRATSIGGNHARKSLTHRKSRASTPGSVYGHSLGGEEESTMDLDSTNEFDTEESIEDILRHIRATFDTSGTEHIFGNSEDDFRREIIVRKIHSFSMDLSTSSQASPADILKSFRVAILSDTPQTCVNEDPRLKLLLHSKLSGEIRYMTIKTKIRPLWPQMSSPQVAIPLLVGEGKMAKCQDILQLRDGQSRTVLIAGQGVLFSVNDEVPCLLPTIEPYRAYEPLPSIQVYGPAQSGPGKNRLLDPPGSPITLQHKGPLGSFDEIGADGVNHRRMIQFRPLDQEVRQIMSVCEYVLHEPQARSIRLLWCMAQSWLSEHPETLGATNSSSEFVACVASILSFALPTLDSKARAVLNISKVAAGKMKTKNNARHLLHRYRHAQQLGDRSAWSWTTDRQRTKSPQNPPGSPENRKDQLLLISTTLADELLPALEQKYGLKQPAGHASLNAMKTMLGLHMLREERKFRADSTTQHELAPVIAQLGLWLGVDAWGPGVGRYYELEGASEERWVFVKSRISESARLPLLQQPIGALQWFEHCLKHATSERYPSLSLVAQFGTDTPVSSSAEEIARQAMPRISVLSDLLNETKSITMSHAKIVERLAQHQIAVDTLQALPEAISSPFKEALSSCEKEPPTTWNASELLLVDREDLMVHSRREGLSTSNASLTSQSAARDMMEVLVMLERTSIHAKTKEAGRHAISLLIFSEDRRLVEASSMMHFAKVQVAQCPKQPEWDEAAHFEHQRRMMHWVTIRMIALPAGDGMIRYDSQTPLLTEKYHLPGFNSACLMQPMGHTLTTDRSGLTEEKVNWAYFHAGVSAGIRISRSVEGIDTSWIAFNKPAELTNRHAGLLLALGLGGHLRHLAKWLSFKYLTPKHTMTSVGLLLGLSASHIGTMDSLITRMLSVHITRMLPPGAAELNVSPATQTAGLMGIGLLYYNTEHRRMSEIMLSEIEYMEMEDPDNGPDMLRDESYRLAAGFALGLINLARGNELRGLYGMHLPERLLAVAVGPRPVNAVHVFDRATAGAVMAIALVYMKTGDKTVARKIDIPDTEAQFDQVRPDVLMLRAMARHIIMWDDIKAEGVGPEIESWIPNNLPKCYGNRSKHLTEQMMANRTIDSAHIPLFNVYTGLAWAMGLKYAGSGDTLARDEILHLLKFFHTLSEGSDAFYYDGKLGRSSLRRCIDVLALCAAMVMAGTGDLETFRYLRRMHGRTDADTSYGSHLAAHLAIGTLFLGGGTFTFGTSNLAIASLIIAFYPLFPTDVHDNRVHLQAFRHLWVLAAEARCIIVEDIDTQRPIHMPIKLTMRAGSIRSLRAPCLLPELDSIALIQTDDPAYWRVTLDFAGNPAHLESFRKDQRIFVRKCPASEAHDSIFSAALAALNDAQTALGTQQIWHTLFDLPAFKDLDKADIELLLPPDVSSSVYLDDRGTVVDDRLVLSQATKSNRRDALWNLRILFAWAERCKARGDGAMKWLGEEVVRDLRARVEERAREVEG